MNWAAPRFFALVALIPVVAIALVWAWRSRRRALAAIASAPAWSELLPPFAERARAWQFALVPFALSGMILAAVGPEYGFDWVQRKSEGVSLVVILDVSTSMDATDVSPNRSERARREVSDLLDHLRGDLVGLVLFANGAFVRLPVTADYDTVRWALGETTTSTITAQGTSISGALDTAGQMLSRAEGSGKGIVLVSDGEFHDDASAVDASVAKLKEAGIPVFALGIGDSSGAPIPLAGGGFKKDRSGNMVLTKLDEDALRGLASATGGAYVRAVVSDEDVRMLYEDQIRAKLVADEHEVSREKKWHERYQIPLSVAFLALVLHAAFGIGPRAKKRRPALRNAALLLLSVLPFHSALAGERSEGLDAFAKKDWDKAVELLGSAHVASPDDPEVGTALGQALYNEGRYREAQQIFDGMAAADPDHRAIHDFNAGHAAYADGRLEEAANRFQVAGKADPKFASAPKNEQAVRKEIQLREQQAQQQQQDQRQEGDSGSQDQQDGNQQQGDQEGAQQQGDQQQRDPQGDRDQSGQNQDQGQESKDKQPEGQQSADHQTGDQQPGDPSGQDPSQTGTEPGEMKQETGEDGEPVAVGDASKGSGMTKADAARLVDGVQDGHPRLRVGGRDTDKDW